MPSARPALVFVLCCAALLGLGVALFLQGQQLRLFIGPVAVPAMVQPSVNVQVISPSSAQLFDRSPINSAKPTKQLALRLLACFVAQSAERSTALLAIGQQSPRRVQVGQYLQEGLRLQAVYAQSVELLVDGQLIRLSLQRAAHPTAATHQYARCGYSRLR